MYNVIKPNGVVSFKTIVLCILVLVDCLILLSIYKFDIISYMQRDCNHPYTATNAHSSYKIVPVNWMR